jgi:superfamily II DNA or RNA helicase
MPRPTLYRHQTLGLRHVLRRLDAGEHRLYVAQPPGTGKTVLLARLAALRLKQGRVLVLEHRQNLVQQTAHVLREEGLEVGELMQGHRALDKPVVVATVQSLTPKMLQRLLAAHATPILTILIDEAHHAIPGSSYARIIAGVEQAVAPLPVSVIGFTATPFRSDAHSMLALLPTCAFERGVPEMQRDGYLAPLTWQPVQLDLDLEALAQEQRDGALDYSEKALAQVLRQDAFSEQIARQVAPLLGERPTLVFAASVRHAERLAEAFARQGLRTATVMGRLGRKERERLYAAWRQGEIQVVCTCALLTEGFDFPAIAALVIARPTRSPVLYLQMLGRGMRTAEGKTDCLVIDVLGNRLDLGRQVVLPRVVTLDGDPALQRAHGPRQKQHDLLVRTREMEGTPEGNGLAVLDPIGHSPYRWIAYKYGYFALVHPEVMLVVERDADPSGLYRSRLALLRPKQPAEQQWIEPRHFPLRQQVERVHQAARQHYQEGFGSKEAAWFEKPATDRQLEALAASRPDLAEQARSEGWTSGRVSLLLSRRRLGWVLTHPPAVKPEPAPDGTRAEGEGADGTEHTRQD